MLSFAGWTSNDVAKTCEAFTLEESGAPEIVAVGENRCFIMDAHISVIA
jgi:hypothetical protein